MSAPEPAPRDLVLRLYDRIPLAPVWVGVGVVLLYLALFVAYYNVIGALQGLTPVPHPFIPVTSWQWEPVNGLIVALLLTGTVYAVRGARKDLGALRPHLRCSDAEFSGLLARATVVPAPLLWLASLVGIACGAAMVAYDPAIWGGHAPPPASDPSYLWALFRNAAVGICVARAMASEAALTWGFWRVGEHARVDLLDLQPLAAFSRKGQRSVALWVGFSMLFSLFWLGDAAASLNQVLVLWMLVVVAAGYGLPLRGVHRRIREAKQAELERLNAGIRQEYASASDLSASPRLANLVAFRQLVEGVREWPVSAPALLRSLFFVALGIGSWLGGAIVERLLNALLD